MSYSEFIDELVVALYHHSELNGIRHYRIQEILNIYKIPVKAFWADVLMTDREFADRVDISAELGPPLQKPVKIAAAGVRWIEENVGENVASFLEQHGLQNPDTRSEVVNIQASVEAEVVPAADRVVPLNHNSAEHKEIAEKLRALSEELRGANDLQVTSEERERLVVSLSAAESLWDATELKVIQVKVGIILAVEDAGKALEKVGKAVGWTLLVDLLKAYLKNKTGIDI
ncbi:hypothetical protein [Altererythrobacter fulvus]|uniref:hypothetical protein n=1 Tax=Caenibius fulvus TaxID=2126012 RepID=UPI0030190A8D